MTVLEADSPPATDWIGRTETRAGCLTAELAGMLASCLCHPAAPMADHRVGAPMPALWHWAAFPEFLPVDALGADGHPPLGGFLPPLPYARRMWAGGDVRLSGQLTIGEPLERSSEILSVTEKDGGAGPMVFVSVRHRTAGAAGQIDEVQDIVYLDIPPEFRPPKQRPLPEALAFDEAVPMSEIRLFRYSAATFNSHRIHYDLRFAREVEKYPALVVHGPMQATLLIEAGQRHVGAPATRFRYRGVHPMFHDHALRLTGWQDGSALALGTAHPDGFLGQTATMEWMT